MLFGVCVLFVFVETYFSRIIEFLSTRLSNVRSRGLAKDSDWYLGQRSSLFLMLMLGCFFFLSVSVLMSTEGWGTMNATCFTTALMITLAFVDQEVTSWEGKAFLIFWVPVSTMLFWYTLGDYIRFQDNRMRRKQRQQLLSGLLQHRDDLQPLANEYGVVTRHAFVRHVLLRLGSVDRDELDAIEEHFDGFDVHGRGVLEPYDLSRNWS